MDYDLEATKKRVEAKRALWARDYNAAATNYESSGSYYLKLARDSKNPDEQLEILNNALKDYKNAHDIILRHQSQKRGDSNNGVREVLELGEKGKDLAKKMRSINSTIDLLKSRQGRKQPLEKNVFGIFSLVSFIFAAIFLSSNLTGFVVMDSSVRNSSAFGLVFFIIGIGFIFLYLTSRSKKK